jgi:hypothetical protein
LKFHDLRFSNAAAPPPDEADGGGGKEAHRTSGLAQAQRINLFAGFSFTNTSPNYSLVSSRSSAANFLCFALLILAFLWI